MTYLKYLLTLMVILMTGASPLYADSPENTGTDREPNREKQDKYEHIRLSQSQRQAAKQLLKQMGDRPKGGKRGIGKLNRVRSSDELLVSRLFEQTELSELIRDKSLKQSIDNWLKGAIKDDTDYGLRVKLVGKAKKNRSVAFNTSLQEFLNSAYRAETLDELKGNFEVGRKVHEMLYEQGIIEELHFERTKAYKDCIRRRFQLKRMQQDVK